MCQRACEGMCFEFNHELYIPDVYVFRVKNKLHSGNALHKNRREGGGAFFN